jgi:hypothetical protein
MAQGDYYRGDGLFSFIGSALKTVAPILPLGLGAAARVVGGALSPAQKAAVNVARVQTFQNPIGGAALPPPPGFSGFQMGGGISVGTSRPTARVGPGRGGVRKKGRRMNVTNVKALRRAGRRVKGFEKMARRFIGFASPRRPKGRMYFRQKKAAK